jgi:hypothetical protein
MRKKLLQVTMCVWFLQITTYFLTLIQLGVELNLGRVKQVLGHYFFIRRDQMVEKVTKMSANLSYVIKK